MYFTSCPSLRAPLDTTRSAISGIKVVDNRMSIAAWAFLAVGCILVLTLAYVGARVCWMKYTGTRHRRLEDGIEMGGAGDEEHQGTYVARGQQLQFLRDDGAE